MLHLSPADVTRVELNSWQWGGSRGYGAWILFFMSRDRLFCLVGLDPLIVCPSLLQLDNDRGQRSSRSVPESRGQGAQSLGAALIG